MEIVMIIVLLIILVGIWVIMTRKKLACLEENVCHAMNQIGVQLDSRARTLEMLWKTTEELAQGELPVSRQYENGNWEKIGGHTETGHGAGKGNGKDYGTAWNGTGGASRMEDAGRLCDLP